MNLIKMETKKHSYRIILVQTYLGKWPLGKYWWRGEIVLTDSWKYWLCRLTKFRFISPGMWHYHLVCSSKDCFTMNRKVLWSFEVWGITVNDSVTFPLRIEPSMSLLWEPEIISQYQVQCWSQCKSEPSSQRSGAG
jgi:hypothetical protein